MNTIAALFVRRNSIYKTLPGVDCFDIDRDASTWPGGCAAIAHPPCRAWSRLRHFARPLQGERDLAIWAVHAVRNWGGVLEHPAGSALWPHMDLPTARSRRIDAHGGYTISVPQNWWGHRAAKLTQLYIVGLRPRDLPPIPYTLAAPTHIIGKGKGGKRSLHSSAREQTPPAFADWLVETARRINASRKPSHV